MDLIHEKSLCEEILLHLRTYLKACRSFHDRMVLYQRKGWRVSGTKEDEGRNGSIDKDDGLKFGQYGLQFLSSCWFLVKFWRYLLFCVTGG